MQKGTTTLITGFKADQSFEIRDDDHLSIDDDWIFLDSEEDDFQLDEAEFADQPPESKEGAPRQTTAPSQFCRKICENNATKLMTSPLSENGIFEKPLDFFESCENLHFFESEPEVESFKENGESCDSSVVWKLEDLIVRGSVKKGKQKRKQKKSYVAKDMP